MVKAPEDGINLTQEDGGDGVHGQIAREPENVDVLA